MNKGTRIALGLLALAGLVLFFIFKNNNTNNLPSSTNNPDIQGINIVYSKHARCRMECRKIDEAEVKEILSYGAINHSKSRKDNRGQTYAYEGRTRDRQNVRIIAAPKGDKVTIVTVIDLDTDWKCDCD